MGKFFDAMQRAAEEKNAAEPSRPVREARQPELDESLLRPEEPGTSSHEAAESPQPQPHRLHRELSDTPSGVLRVLDSGIRSAPNASPPTRNSTLGVAQARIQSVKDQAAAAQSLTKPLNQNIEELREPFPTAVRVHPAYDRIVQRLLSYRRAPRQGAILVTSAIAREGTSTVARNLATALSQGGNEQVLLVDANLRTPSQHAAFHLDRDRGFSEVLQGDLSLASAIRDDIGSGISLMTSGAPVKSPSQILKAAAVQGAVMALLSLYDWIILDSPPATTHPDVASLGTACGGAILVVRAENTRSEVAEEAKGILQGTGTEILGAVLNRRRFHIPQFIYKRL